MLKPLRNFSCVTTCFATLAAVCFQSSLAAEQTLRTADGLLAIQADIPAEVRAGEQFEFNVTVTNSSDDVMLHDVVLRQRKAKGFSVESMIIHDENRSDKRQNRESHQNDDAQTKASKQKQSSNDENKSSSNKSAAKQKNAETGQSGNSQRDRLTIASLAPGESQTILVKASAENEGELRACLEIYDYKPSLCLTSRVVKPELKLTKEAPEKANRCDVITIRYTATNNGTGDVGEFKIVDDLGDGLATIKGNQKLEFMVDGLKAGDSREFIARVYATKLGKFSSRATAEAQNSDLKSRSSETTTSVVAADLSVAIEGNSRLYGDELAKFTAHITNTGNAPAQSVQVRLMWPEQAQLVDIGNPQVSNSRSENSNNNDEQKRNASQSTAAKNSKAATDKGNKSKQKREKMTMSEQEIIIDELQPGETASFDYALRPGDLDRIPTQIEALYVCALEPVEDKNAQAKVTSTANAEVAVVRLPALQIVVVDDEDPVRDGEQVTYTVRIWNEGDAADQDVKLTAELPEGLEFVSASGPTEHELKGSTVRFQPIESMEPGESKDFRIVTKNRGDGNVILKASLSSKSLPSKVTSEEPTRLVNRQASK